MATTLYLRFTEATDKMPNPSGQYETNATAVTTTIDPNSSQFFRIDSFSTDVQNMATVGSATSGAGGGKIQFNALNISRRSDAASAILFRNCAAGMHYKLVELYVANNANQVLSKYLFKTVFTTAIAWAGNGDDSAMETISFSYGVLALTVGVQAADGKITAGPQYGWNQMKNIQELS